MAFSVTHRSTIDRNIRHLYSGLPGDIRFRNYGNSLDSALDIHDRVWERHRRQPPRFEGKYNEYISEYNACLPRAPAFRHVSSEEVRVITTRLSQPTLVSILRQRAPTSGRSTSRSPAACSSQMTISDGGRDGSKGGDDKEKKENSLGEDRHRKISYKEWSDDEVEYYFVGESEERNQTGDDKGNINEEVDTRSSYKDINGTKEAKYLSDNDSKKGDSCSDHDEDYNNLNDRNNFTPHDSDDEMYNKQNQKGEIQLNNNWSQDQSEYANGSIISSNNEKKQNRTKHQNKKKLTILEEIMQLRLSNKTTRQTHIESPTPKKRNCFENRGRVHRRLTHSPYNEPASRLRNECGTRECNPAKMSRRNWRDPNQSYPNTSTNTNQRIKESFSQRSQIRECLISSRFETSQNKSAKEFTRNKSAPAYKIIPETGDVHRKISRENGKPLIRNSSQNTKDIRNNNEKDYSAQLSNSEKNYYTKHGGNCSKPNLSPSSSRSRNKSTMAISPVFLNNNYDQLGRSNCCTPAVENDFLLRFDIKPAGKRTFIAGDAVSRRYSSFQEMEQANARLMAPTTAKLIRDRMRYAPSNDKDLLDPVKVVRQETGRKKHNDLRGSLERDSIDDEDIEEKDDNEKEKDDKIMKAYRERNNKDSTKMKVKSDWKMQTSVKGIGNNQPRGDKKSTREKKSNNYEEKKKQRKEKKKKKEEETGREKTKGSLKESNRSTETPGRKIDCEDERGATPKQNYEQSEKKEIEKDYSDLDTNATSASADILVSGQYENAQDKALKSTFSSSNRSRSGLKSRSRSSESSKSRNSSSSRSTSMPRYRSRSSKRSRFYSKELGKSRSSSREIKKSETKKSYSDSISRPRIRSRSISTSRSRSISTSSSRSRSRSSSPSVSSPNSNHRTMSPDRNESLSSPKGDGPRGQEKPHSDNVEGFEVNDKGMTSTDDPLEANNKSEEDVIRGIVDDIDINDERGNKIERTNEEWGQRNDVFDITENRRNSDALESRIKPRDFGSDNYNVVSDRMIRGQENAMDNEWRDFNDQNRYEHLNEDSTIISDAQGPREYILQENNGFDDGLKQRYHVTNDTKAQGNNLHQEDRTVERSNQRYVNRYDQIAPDTIQEIGDRRTQENNVVVGSKQGYDHEQTISSNVFQQLGNTFPQENKIVQESEQTENDIDNESIIPNDIHETVDNPPPENSGVEEEDVKKDSECTTIYDQQRSNNKHIHETVDNLPPENSDVEKEDVKKDNECTTIYDQQRSNDKHIHETVDNLPQENSDVEKEDVKKDNECTTIYDQQRSNDKHIHETVDNLPQENSDVEKEDVKKDNECTTIYDQQRSNDKYATQERSVKEMLATLDNTIHHNVSNGMEGEM